MSYGVGHQLEHGDELERPDLGADARFVERYNYLYGLPRIDWPDEGELVDEVRVLTAHTGIRVEPYQALAYQAIAQSGDRHEVMGWGLSSGTLYTRWSYRYIPLKEKLMSVIHEGGHAIDVHDLQNAAYFGGETGRQAAAEYNARVARQSLDAGTYLTTYHANLAKRFLDPTDKEIDWLIFCTETWAIHLSLALMYGKREELQEVAARQRQALLKQGVAEENILPLGIDWEDKSTAGLGGHLTNGALYGVHDLSSLCWHITSLDERLPSLSRYEHPIVRFSEFLGRTIMRSRNSRAGHIPR